MTKARYIYELIENCMVLVCENNILLENFELVDDLNFQDSMERQFLDCVKFYDEMKELSDRGVMDEPQMDQELRSFLARIRQNALISLYNDFCKFIDQMDIPEAEETVISQQKELLKEELGSKVIDLNFLCNKIDSLREIEEEYHKIERRG
jgi:hypothetical protein